MSTPDLPEQLAQAREQAASPDGLVTVTVDGTGTLLDLHLDPKAMREPAQQLAALIGETVRGAQEAAREHTRTLLRDASAATPDLAALSGLAASLEQVAQTRLTEISAALDRLTGGQR